MMLWRILFVTAVLAFEASLHLYVYRRLVRDPSRSDAARRAGKIILGALWLVLAVGPVLLFNFRAAWTEAISTISWFWLGLSALLTVLLFAAEPLQWAMKRAAEKGRPVEPSRRLFLSRAVAAAAVGSAGGLAGYGVFRAYSAPEVTELALRLPRLPRALDGLTVVQLTDIHAGPLIRRPFLEDMVERCRALRPDLMAITGDLVDGDVPTLGPSVSALANLRARFGTYFVTGNHEYYSGDLEWAGALERWGIHVLRNRRVSVGDAGASFDLIGVDDWQGRPGRRYDLDAALRGRDPERASVLLAHQPRNFEEAARAGVGLQLSGHTHGGQLFPMTLAINLIWKRAVGHYALGDSHLYVSRGTGFWGPPMRVGSPPEIVKLTLLSA